MLIRMLALIGRILARSLAHVRVEGLEHIPRRGAVILAANHISNADPVVAGSWITGALGRRRIHWLGKRELFDWPVIGWAAAHGGVHPVDRGAADVEAFRLATRILEAGYVLLVFPEGTRSPTGELREAKDGLAMLAMRTGAQIVPDRGQQHGRGLEEGPASCPRRSRAAPSRCGSGSRSASPTSCPAEPTAGPPRRWRPPRSWPGSRSSWTRATAASTPTPSGRSPARTLSRKAHTAARSPHVCEHRSAMGMVQEVRIANRTGFCYGVREAIDKAKESAVAGRPTHTLGQVVHNEGVIRDLVGFGVRSVDTLDDVDEGAAVVIRAHGVNPEVFERAESRGLDVIDGTCTWVIQEQRQLQELVDEGYTIVLLGTPRHPEVVGLLGFAPGRDRGGRGGGLGTASRAASGWRSSPSPPSRPGSSRSWPPSWSSRAHELKIVNTVCPVTIRRQEDTLETAREVDLMVVVGGRHSANTKELTRLCQIAGTPAVQIENARDLDGPARRSTAPRVVGVTGGTSTPVEDLRDVARRIFELAGTDELRARAAELAAGRARRRGDARRPHHLAAARTDPVGPAVRAPMASGRIAPVRAA